LRQCPFWKHAWSASSICMQSETFRDKNVTKARATPKLYLVAKTPADKTNGRSTFCEF